MQVVTPPKILNFNLIDNVKIVYEDKNLTSNPKQTKKTNFKKFRKKFRRFFCFDAGDEDDYIITNSFSPPGAVVNGQMWTKVNGRMVKLVMVEKIYCNNDLFFLYKCQ